MIAMPIKTAKPPSAILSQPNGAVDEALLEQVDDRKGYLWKLASGPARGMRAMHAAIKRDLGITLTTTGRGRDLAGQWLIFGGKQARYQPCSQDDFNTNKAKNKELVKSWPAAARHAVAELLHVDIPEAEFWTKIPDDKGRFPATAAVPGTSPHGFWCADDLALPDVDKHPGPDDLTDPVVEWLFIHEHEFGFAHGTPSERWHVQWVEGDNIPAAVLAFEATQPNGGRPTTTATSITINLEEVEMIKAIKVPDNDAVFTASGGVASWVNDPADFQRLVAAKLAPEQIDVVDRATLGALRLVGAVPPGFAETDFQQVVTG